MVTSAPNRADKGIVRQAVLCLSARLPELTDRLVSEILAGKEGRRPAELLDDLWETCHIGLGRGIEAILDPGGRRVDLRWAERLGRLRAEQGQPLDQLLRSYRLAGRVFWEALVEVVSRDHPAQVPALVRQAALTWQTIDEQSSTAAEAYHHAEYELLRRSEERMQAVVDALLEGREAEGPLLNAATEVLGLPARSRYAVAVLRDEAGEDALGRREHPRPAGHAGMRFVWRMRAGTTVALVHLGTADLDDLVEALRPHTRGHAGVSPVVEALADLGRARWLAELALRTCWAPGFEIARLDRRLPDALVAAQPDLAGRLRHEVLGPLAEVSPAFRTALLETLTTWLDCDGSAARAAARLYCHHNTVLNRLRRIEQLTGRSLTRPRELAEMVLALHASHLHGPER
ncbi:MAG TPA: helix-turn-helix domain-containing protein [Actinomadura sp.]|jgi:hypothetical protein|nr:helix-turn-helix domain-containing protein [Actinomadura sp.]